MRVECLTRSAPDSIILLFAGSVRLRCQRDYPLGIGNSLVSASLWEFLEHLRVSSDASRPDLHARACVHHGTVAHRSKGLGSGAYFRYGWPRRKMSRPNGLRLLHACPMPFVHGDWGGCVCGLALRMASAVGARSAAQIFGRSMKIWAVVNHEPLPPHDTFLSFDLIRTCLYLVHGVV